MRKQTHCKNGHERAADNLSGRQCRICRNVLRGLKRIRKGYKRTHCKFGHELTENNVYRHGKAQKRRCKICAAVWDKEWRLAHPERVATTARFSGLKKRYGLAKDDYNRLLMKQNGVCPVCKKPPIENQSLHVDHDHTTNEIRGLLHLTCNAAIGQLCDSPDILRSAAAYLENPPFRIPI